MVVSPIVFVSVLFLLFFLLSKDADQADKACAHTHTHTHLAPLIVHLSATRAFSGPSLGRMVAGRFGFLIFLSLCPPRAVGERALNVRPGVVFVLSHLPLPLVRAKPPTWFGPFGVACRTSLLTGAAHSTHCCCIFLPPSPVFSPLSLSLSVSLCLCLSLSLFLGTGWPPFLSPQALLRGGGKEGTMFEGPRWQKLPVPLLFVFVSRPTSCKVFSGASGVNSGPPQLRNSFSPHLLVQSDVH